MLQEVSHCVSDTVSGPLTKCVDSAGCELLLPDTILSLPTKPALTITTGGELLLPLLAS